MEADSHGSTGVTTPSPYANRLGLLMGWPTPDEIAESICPRLVELIQRQWAHPGMGLPQDLVDLFVTKKTPNGLLIPKQGLSTHPEHAIGWTCYEEVGVGLYNVRMLEDTRFFEMSLVSTPPDPDCLVVDHE